jgi:signal transduction histidine kinase
MFQEHNFLLGRALVILVLFLIGLFCLLFKAPWTVSSHIFTGCLTLLVWSNVLLFPSGLTIITVQYTLMVFAVGYYILGMKWGVTYSLINILPLLGSVIIDTFLRTVFPLQKYAINNQAYALTICFNFLLLMFIHYSFFLALKKSKMKETKLRTELQIALEEAQELAAAKSNFLTTMSHELRTPLNAVVGITNILMMENQLAEQTENLKILKFSAENLSATVNDILDFNKINNGKIILEMHAFPISDLLEKVADTFRHLAGLKSLQFESQVDSALVNVELAGDRMRLTQILFHLLGNAVKFTEQGYVSMQVRMLRQDDKEIEVQFNVADSGIGIPDEVQQGIFDPFSKSLSRTSRQFHGALGLTIAAQLVKLHHSELHFESREGKGTTFEFKLKYQISTQQPIMKVKKGIVDISILRVLVVEDEKLNVLVMKKILSKWGIVPDIAYDGQQAVNQVTKRNYDVILMDINMPVMDGFEASRRIKDMDDKSKSGIPIIAITASVGAAIEHVKDYPFIDDWVLKPFEPDLLREKLGLIATGILRD